MKKKVIVHWIDAESDSSWKSLEEIKDWAKKAYQNLNESTGEIVLKTKNYIVVSGSKDSYGNFGELTMIPKGWVKKIKEIK